MIPKTPLPWASYSGPDPSYALEEGGRFEQLEGAYGQSISAPARAGLSRIADDYLADRRVELSRQTWRDVADNLAPLEQAATTMWALAYGAPPANGDAAYAFDAIVDQFLDRDAVPIRPNRGDLVILRPDEKGSSWERFDDHYQPPEVGFGIRLTREILRDIAQALRVAANRSASEIEKRALEAAADTLPAWTAQQRLLLRLGEWARDFGLLYGPYYNGEVPSKFSEFVCALLQMAPEGYREKALTAGAVAERIRRVRKEAGAKKREQLTRAHGK